MKNRKTTIIQELNSIHEFMKDKSSPHIATKAAELVERITTGELDKFIDGLKNVHVAEDVSELWEEAKQIDLKEQEQA
jgi:hypothetical protein